MLRPPDDFEASSKHFSACLRDSSRSESLAPVPALEDDCREARRRKRTPRVRKSGGKAGLIRRASLIVEVASRR
jgi:hypothetical protein